MFRYRLDYSKLSEAKYTSMLDLQKLWERIIRRSRIPIAYSQGFHPLPKFQMAAPLPLGFEGSHELLDIWCEEELSLDVIEDNIKDNSPSGIILNSIKPLPLNEPLLQIQVKSADYCVKPLVQVENVAINARIYSILEQSSIIRIRRNKQYDLRPLIFLLEIKQKDKDLSLFMTLQSREGATGRPDEVIAEMGYEPLEFSYCRLNLNLE